MLGGRRRSTRRRRRGARTVPAHGTKPPIAFISVDLPAPLVPMRPTISSFADPQAGVVDRDDTAEPHGDPSDLERGHVLHDRRPHRADEHRRRLRHPLGRRRFTFRCRPREQRVARRVRDLHQPTREVEEQDQQAEARRQQRHQRVVGEERRETDDPQGAEHRAHGRRDATDHHERDQRERVGHQEVALGERHRFDRAGQQRAAEPGDEPGDRECTQLRRGHADRVRRSSVGVVAHRDRRAADARSAEPAHDDERHHEHGEAHVVVGALRRQVEAEQRSARERHRRQVVGQHRLAEQVLRRGDRERERADREQQASDTERAHADQRREPGGGERGDHDREEERHRRRGRGARRPGRGSGRGSTPPRPGHRIRRRPSGPRTAGPPSPVSTISESPQIAKQAMVA